jgi:hypothetical protein
LEDKRIIPQSKESTTTKPDTNSTQPIKTEQTSPSTKPIEVTKPEVTNPKVENENAINDNTTKLDFKEIDNNTDFSVDIPNVKKYINDDIELNESIPENTGKTNLISVDEVILDEQRHASSEDSNLSIEEN